MSKNKKQMTIIAKHQSNPFENCLRGLATCNHNSVADGSKFNRTQLHRPLASVLECRDLFCDFGFSPISSSGAAASPPPSLELLDTLFVCSHSFIDSMLSYTESSSSFSSLTSP